MKAIPVLTVIKIENILKIEVRTERLQTIVYAAKTDISMYFCFRGIIFIFVLATVKSCFSFDHCIEFYFKGEDHGELLRPASI